MEHMQINIITKKNNMIISTIGILSRIIRSFFTGRIKERFSHIGIIAIYRVEKLKVKQNQMHSVMLLQKHQYFFFNDITEDRTRL